MSQQALGREDHERCSPGGERLTPEHVKVLGCSGWLTDLQVVLGGELEKSFDASTRMLGPLALVPVWQQECQSGQAPPFVFSRDDELIDDDLRVVREVAELSLPEDERLRIVPTVPVFEP